MAVEVIDTFEDEEDPDVVDFGVSSEEEGVQT
jgi:hypothetical protein